MEKKTKKIIYLSLFFISCILILFCISLSKSKTTKKEKIVNKTKNSTTYEEKDGRKKIIIYNANIRFEDENGKLIDYDPSLIKSKKTEFAYENKLGDSKVYLPTKISNHNKILLTKDSAEISLTPMIENQSTNIAVSNETSMNANNETVSIPTKATYKLENITYEYISEINGLKENIILTKKPTSNIFEFKLSLTDNLIAEKSKITESILIKDRNSNELKAILDSANMNDATDNAYSENITYSLKKSNDNEYTLKMVLDKNYLNSKKRVYPIIIDPSVSWNGDSNIIDTYISNNSKYADINFYDSGVTAFSMGYTSSMGTCRSLLKAMPLLNTVKNKSIKSAKLTMYETSSCDKNISVNAYRIIDDWTKTSVSWNTKPRYNVSEGKIGTTTTTGKLYAANVMDITTYVKNLSNTTHSNDYGLMLKLNSDTTSSAGYVKYFGSRHSNVNLQPKLTIEYYDAPTAPTNVSLSKSYLKLNESSILSWNGISSYQIDSVEYRIAKRNDETDKIETTNVINYTKIGNTTSGSVSLDTIKTLSEGCYSIFVRGVDAAGNCGPEKRYDFHIDNTAPIIDNISMQELTNGVKISWINVSDLHFKELMYAINDGEYKLLSKNKSGSYEIEQEKFSGSGKDIIYIIAIDEANNISNITSLDYIYNVSPNLSDFNATDVSASTSYGKIKITWTTSTKQTQLPDDVSYNIYKGISESNVNTLLATNIKNFYFEDINLDTDAYYAIQAVSKNEKSDKSIIVHATSLSSNDFSLRTGKKNYLSYSEFTTPNGTGTIEQSSGNLTYSQVDATLPTEKINYDIKRTYNSQLKQLGMFGIGWSDNFHKELYKVNNSFIFSDSDGTNYSFDSNYNCIDSKDITLKVNEKMITNNYIIGTNAISINSLYEITTKNNDIYKFNDNGQLVEITEPNETAIYFIYDSMGRLFKIINTNTVVLQLTYNTKNLVSEIILPDNSVLTYLYSNNLLTRVRHYSEKNSGIYVDYKFEYNKDKKLSKIVDALNNSYKLNYESNKLIKFTYPNNEYNIFEYQTNTTTAIKYTEDDREIAKSTIIFDTKTGKTLKEVAVDGKETTYIYDNYLLKSSSTMIDYQEVINNVVETKTKNIETNYTYNENEDIIAEAEIIKENNVEVERNKTLYMYDLTKKYSANFPTEIKNLTIKNEGAKITETITSVYDDYGNLSEYTDEKENSIDNMKYNENGLISELISIKTENDKTIQNSKTIYTYDSFGNNIIKEEKGQNLYSKKLNEYDNMGRIIKKTELYSDNVTKKSETTYEYDYLGRLVKTETKKDSTSEQIISQEEKEYNDNGTITKIISNGLTKTYEYDTSNRLIKETIYESNYPNVSISYHTQYSYETLENYNDNGKMVDKKNILTTKTYKNDSTVLYSISYTDAKGNLLRKLENGIYTDYTYNLNNEQISIVETGSDSLGNIDLSQKRITLYIIDENGNNTQIIKNPIINENKFMISDDSVVSESGYDDFGNIISEIDSNGNKTSYIYDSQNRVTSIANAMNITTNISHETSNNLDITNILSPLTKISQEAKDFDGNIIWTKDIANNQEKATTYEYDENGNKVKETFANGNYITYEYANDSLQYVKYFTNDNIQTLESEYSYISSGDLKYIRDYKIINGEKELYNTIFYDYNARHQLVGYAELNNKNNDIDYFESKLSYDLNGNLSSVRYPESFLMTNNRICLLTYKYDENTNNLKKVYASRTDGKQFLLREYIYSNMNEVVETKDYNISNDDYISTIYKYDIFGRITKIEMKDSNQSEDIKESHTYTYDKNSNVLSETLINNYPQNDSEKVNETKTYEYNELNQLVISSVKNNKTNITNYYTYNYDANGNIISSDEILNNYKMTRSKIYSYDEFDQLILTTETENENLISNKTYEYDENGNTILINDSIQNISESFVYDVSNRLTKYTRNDNGTIVEQTNKYNGLDKRVAKTEDNKTIYYFYLNENVLYTLDDNDNHSSHNIFDSNGNLISTFRMDNNELQYYIYTRDKQKNVINLINTDGVSEVSYKYSDFGETTIIGNINFYNEICYSSSIYDSLSKLYYLNARYYTPDDSRFITKDTYRGELDQPDTQNLYMYCYGNPINNIDISGHTYKNIKTKTIKTKSYYKSDYAIFPIKESGKIQLYTDGGVFSDKVKIVIKNLNVKVLGNASKIRSLSLFVIVNYNKQIRLRNVTDISVYKLLTKYSGPKTKFANTTITSKTIYDKYSWRPHMYNIEFGIKIIDKHGHNANVAVFYH